MYGMIVAATTTYAKTGRAKEFHDLGEGGTDVNRIKGRKDGESVFINERKDKRAKTKDVLSVRCPPER